VRRTAPASVLTVKPLAQPRPAFASAADLSAEVALDKASSLGPSAQYLTEVIGQNWHRLKEQPRPKPSLSPVRHSQPKPANFARMERAFRSLPADHEWIKKSTPVVKEQRDSLGRGGIGLVSVECRTGACRYEFEFKDHRAVRRHQLLHGRPSTRATADRLIHTWFPTPEVAKTVVFLARDGQELPKT
jgi:hypothetical protein